MGKGDASRNTKSQRESERAREERKREEASANVDQEKVSTRRDQWGGNQEKRKGNRVWKKFQP